VFARERPDAVVHLAALVSPTESWYREAEYYAVNVLGTSNVARAAWRNGVRVVVLASSSAVYGDAYDRLGRALRESDEKRPLSPYGLSKLMAEQVLDLAYRERGLRYVALRLGNVYSRYDDKYLFWRLWVDEPFTLRDPDAVRDFVSATDVSALVVAAVEACYDGGGCVGPVNVGAEPRRVGDVVERFRGIAGRPRSVRSGSGLLPGEYRRMVLDTSRARELFGWEPRLRLFDDGLRCLVEAFRRRTP